MSFSFSGKFSELNNLNLTFKIQRAVKEMLKLSEVIDLEPLQFFKAETPPVRSNLFSNIKSIAFIESFTIDSDENIYVILGGNTGLTLQGPMVAKYDKYGKLINVPIENITNFYSTLSLGYKNENSNQTWYINYDSFNNCLWGCTRAQSIGFCALSADDYTRKFSNVFYRNKLGQTAAFQHSAMETIFRVKNGYAFYKLDKGNNDYPFCVYKLDKMNDCPTSTATVTVYEGGDVYSTLYNVGDEVSLPHVQVFAPTSDEIVSYEIIGDHIWILTRQQKTTGNVIFRLWKKYIYISSNDVYTINLNRGEEIDVFDIMSNIHLSMAYSSKLGKLLLITPSNTNTIQFCDISVYDILNNVIEKSISVRVEGTSAYTYRDYYGNKAYTYGNQSNHIGFDDYLDAGDFIVSDSGFLDVYSISKLNNGECIELYKPSDFYNYSNRNSDFLVTRSNEIFQMRENKIYALSPYSNKIMIYGSKTAEQDVLSVSGTATANGNITLMIDPDYYSLGSGAAVTATSTGVVTLYKSGFGYKVDDVLYRDGKISDRIKITSVDSNGGIVSFTKSGIWNTNTTTRTLPFSGNVMSSGILNNYNIITVPITSGDSSTVIATKIRDALNDDVQYKLQREHQRFIATATSNEVLVEYSFSRPTIKINQTNDVGVTIETYSNKSQIDYFTNIYRIGKNRSSPFNGIESAISYVESVLSDGDTAMFLVDNDYYQDNIRSSQKINMVFKGINNKANGFHSGAAIIKTNTLSAGSGAITLTPSLTNNRFLILEDIIIDNKNPISPYNTYYPVYYINNGGNNTTYLIMHSSEVVFSYSTSTNGEFIYRECSNSGHLYVELSSSRLGAKMSDVVTNVLPLSGDQTTISARSDLLSSPNSPIYYKTGGTTGTTITSQLGTPFQNSYFGGKSSSLLLSELGLYSTFGATIPYQENDPKWFSDDGGLTKYIPSRIKSLLDNDTIGYDDI